MVRNHRKPSKVMVKKSKTIEKPLIAMVRPPKNIQWWWSPQNHWKFTMVSSKPLKFTMVSLKPLNLSMVLSNQYSLKRIELSCGHNTILIWLFWRKVYSQSSLIFIAAHCSCRPNLPHPTIIQQPPNESFISIAPLFDICRPCYKINCAKHNEKWTFVRLTHLWTYTEFVAIINGGRHFFSGVEFHTVKWCMYGPYHMDFH